MKILVVYYSYTRSNAILARRLQKTVGADLFEIEEVKRRTGFTILLDLIFNRRPAIKATPVSVKDYDHVIFIAPIWASRVAAPLAAFIRNEKDNIRRYSFLTLCGGVDGQKEKIVRQLAALSGKDPAFVTELWLKSLPMPKEKRDRIKWNQGYEMDDTDLKFFESRIQAFLNMSGIRHGEDVAVQERGH